MNEPFGSTPDADAPERDDLVRADEIVAAPDPSRGRPAPAEGPLREIAHAFRMNAEALHTLKQMQGDLAKQVRRGDRSELVVQSTQALNETFRNLTSVQQELLRRIQQGQGPSRSSLVPLMLIGLLVVLLGGIYVILDALDKRGPADPELAPAEVARRERAAWKEGREEGASQAEREIERLQAAIGENQRRSAQLQGDLDAKLQQLAEIDQRKRAAEMERDDFASQVRKAQSEMMAKQVLEEEVGSLKLQLDALRRTTADADHALDLERRKNSYLRERAADAAMGISPDDPPWRPGNAATTPEETVPPKDFVAIGRERLRALGLETDADAPGPAPGNSSVPPPAYDVGDGPVRADRPVVSTVPMPAARVPTIPIPTAVAPPAGRQGAAYGADGPGALPPPSILRRGETPASVPAVAAPAAPAESVRTRINDLLRSSDTRDGGGWRVARVGGITADGLQGVLLVRYAAGGRVAESVEARSLRIDHDAARREVEFTLSEGMRFAGGQSMPLPAVGSRVVVAKDAQSELWSQAALPVIRTR